jgi:hypothetical protein
MAIERKEAQEKLDEARVERSRATSGVADRGYLDFKERSSNSTSVKRLGPLSGLTPFSCPMNRTGSRPI